MNKIIWLILAIIISEGCVSSNKLAYKFADNKMADSLSSIRVILAKQNYIFNGIFTKKQDSAHYLESKQYELAKIKRKLSEFEIKMAYDSLPCSKELDSSILNYLWSLRHAEDIKTILLEDKFQNILNNYSERYFLFYFHYGIINSKPNYFFHNIPFYLLDKLTFGFYSVRWGEGFSWIYFAIFDKKAQRCNFYGRSYRIGYPYDEITINKHFEEFLDKFIHTETALK
jgi:hypothetical protein